jgi:hypothetical protein
LNLIVESHGTPFSGEAQINLRASFGGVTTSLNNGSIVLVPPPTDSFDTGLARDARYTVLFTVPEPGSLVLLALGGLGGLVWRRRRAG